MSETALNLQKGERVDLTKTNPGLKEANVGLGWDTNAGSGAAFDLDAFALLLKDGKLYHGTDAVIYFNHKEALGLQHMGDNLTGAGDGDDETIKVHLNQIPADVTEVLIGVNIYQAESRHQHFGMVNNAFIRVYNAEDAKEILKFDLSEDYSAFNGMIMGKIYRKDGEWKFQAIGEGRNGSIDEIARPYKA